METQHREPGIALSVVGPETAPEGPENLVCRAGELLSGRSGSRVGAEIHYFIGGDPGFQTTFDNRDFIFYFRLAYRIGGGG